MKLNIDMTEDEKKAEFEPNIINSTVYLICMGLQVSTFAVNYKGHPYMESLRENKMLMYSIFASSGVVLSLALNLVPDLQSAFQIIDFPDDVSELNCASFISQYLTSLSFFFSLQFRKILVTVLIADTVLAFVVDKTCAFLFGENRRKIDIINDN